MKRHIFVGALLLLSATVMSARADTAGTVISEDFGRGLAGYEAVGDNAKRLFTPDTVDGKSALLCLASSGKATLRKFNITLDPGKRYVLTARIKSEDIELTTSSKGKVFIITDGWNWESSNVGPAKDTSDWAEYSTTFTPRASSNGKYQLIISPPSQGKLWVTDIRLTEKDPGAKAVPGTVVNDDFAEGVRGYEAVGANAKRLFMPDTTDGKSSVLCLASPGKTTLRKFNITLDPNKEYTLTARIKSEGVELTSDFRGKVFIISEGWNWESSKVGPAKDTSDWAEYSTTFAPRASSNGKYQLVISCPPQGKMWVTDIRLAEKQ